jgi:hypothetical protein
MSAAAAVKGAQRAVGRILDGGGRRHHRFALDRRATSAFHAAFLPQHIIVASAPLDIGSLPTILGRPQTGKRDRTTGARRTTRRAGGTG